NTTTFKFAHCLIMMVAASFAVLPWCPRRFGLRGFLMTTTVIAVVVGLVVAVDSHFGRLKPP
ncbi:MAG: hypothetical protein AAF961_00515, partial [Planctomycetota bacterium]